MDSVLVETTQGADNANAIRHYLAARNKAVTPEIIQKSFIKAGLNPINPNIFTESDYAPSKNTSINAPTPPSYPKETPYTLNESPSERDLPTCTNRSCCTVCKKPIFDEAVMARLIPR